MTNLVTLDEYKIAENIQSVKEDGRIESLITSVSQLVKTYCGNSIIDFFGSDKVEEISINWATNIVQLTESPLVSVTSVQEREDYSKAYTTLGTSDYYADTSTDTIYRVTKTGQSKNWETGPASVKVTYKAGYASTPADLKLAVFDLITYYLKDEHKARQTLAGASIQNQSSSSQRNNVAVPDHIKRVFELYKNF